MATRESTIAASAEAIPVQAGPLQNPPLTDIAPAAAFADAPPPHPQSSPTFKPRQLKISYLPLTRESVPFLRLSGKWLAQAGFHIGAHVRIAVDAQRLLIETKAPESKSRSEILNERRAALATEAALDPPPQTPTALQTFGAVESVHGRGDRQPNLSTFIAIAWTLDQDPRELLDKLLLQMGFPSGTRPVISPRNH